MKVMDCNAEGLVLENQTILMWHEIEVLGRCEYPRANNPWEFYYLRRKGSKRNVTLRDFKPELRLKIYQQGNGWSEFVTKTTHFGKESSLDIAKEIKNIEFYFSPESQRIRREFKRQAPIILAVFFGVLIILIAGVIFFGQK